MTAIDFSEWINYFVAIAGTGVITTLASLKYARRTAAADAKQREIDASKSEQDMYQEMIADLRQERKEMKAEFEDKISKQNAVIEKQAGIISELKQAILSLEAQTRENRIKLEDAERKLRQADEDRKRLAEQDDELKQLRAKLEESQQRVDEYKKEAVYLRQELAIAKQENDSLRSAMAGMQAEHPAEPQQPSTKGRAKSKR